MPSVNNFTASSPSCKFKILFCSCCETQIPENSVVNCDGCQKSFHNFCIESMNSQQSMDSICLCIDCSNDDKICSNKDRLDIKSVTKSKAKTVNSRLRPRTVSVDYYGSQSNSNSKAKEKVITSAKPTLTKSHYNELLHMIEKLQNRLEMVENNKCKCNNAHVKQFEKLAEHEIGTENLAENVTSASVDFAAYTESMASLQKLSNANNKEIIAINDKMRDLTELYHSNDDSISSDISVLNDRLNLLDVNLKGALKSLDYCETLFETNTTYCVEIDKQMIEINNRLAGCEPILETKTELTVANTEIIESINSLNDVVGRIKNTIITRFDLHPEYNAFFTEKLNKNLQKMNRLAAQINSKNCHFLPDDNANRLDANERHNLFDRINIRPMYQRNNKTNRLQFYIFGAKRNESDIRNNIAAMLQRFGVADADTIEWFINKETYNVTSHQLNNIKYIVSIRDPVNINDLKSFAETFFGE